MPLDVTAQVRLRISDRWRFAEEVRGGDGTASAWKLAQGAPFASILSGSAAVATPAGWSGTGANFDTGLGLVTFANVISANSAWRAGYQWALFSEDEVTQFLMDGGSVPGAALQACRSLMFDSLRRARWAAPGGTQFDDTKAMDQLQKLYDQLLEEVRDGQISGGLESWSENQAYWSSEYGA